ncbi:PAS domain S-box protein [Candidatus Sulfurimonas marisnigri]|uniref:PAS domain S-box protein n=1 Tax=Candidatus Sulfurimonas marisnigri TaxID=2740405 RepID=A0A7S7LZA8_9BACT|nr:PAS domain S-box protein [Candidatus Sulfurimonas marisnigri]QOY54212.1 PAS domain S-box protein [Candidatus Sulfurimonas marisnigri]
MKNKFDLDILKKYTVLYVEDNKEISEEIAFFLSLKVKELFIAYNGEEGIDLFKQNKPEIIITDIQMPIMNGIEMINIIRQNNKDIPIVVTTAFNESDYLLQAINLHVDAYLIKPLNLKEFMESIGKIVEPMELRVQLDENNYYLEQFKNAVEEASIFSTSDEYGNIKEVNKNFELISGYTKEELIGKPHSIIRHEDMSAEVYADMWKTIKSGKVWNGLLKNKKKNAKAYYVILEISPIYNKDGSFREYIGIRNDVTELEEYKNILKNELDTTHQSLDENLNYTQQYEDAINATTAIMKTDTKNIITYVNEKFCELSGYDNDEVVGKNCQEIRHEKYRKLDKCEQLKDELSNNKIVHEILTNITKDGEEYTVDNLIYPIVGLSENIVEHIHVMHDLTEIIKLNQEIIDTQKEVVLTMGAIGETRSRETGLHVKRVAEYSYHLAKLIGLSEEEAALLKQASPMHDIGKVGIPDSILNKPGILTYEEFEVMKTHVTIGHEMLKYSHRAILKASSIVALTHHEKWNGTGYPNALKGEEIHIYGRITAIADVFDALGHDRVYKNAWELDDILSFFKKESGSHFDPKLVELFFNHLEDFLEIRKSMRDDVCEITKL